MALYVTDYDKPLKLSGKSKIFGKIEIPNGRIEQVYINGRKGNEIQLKGEQFKSKGSLPSIRKDIYNNVYSMPNMIYNFNSTNSIINGFDEDTKIIDLNEISALKNITCKGNYILISENALVIDRSAKLNDVVIIAPRVKIETGFSGNVQIFAKQEVIVEENVSLLYPSSIYVKNDTDAVSVELKNNATVVGGIIIDGDEYNNSLERKLIIEENATIIGDVYCYGSTQLKGNVIGSVYTDRFFLETDASNYENVILNGLINRDDLLEGFISLTLFDNAPNEEKYAVIKEF